MLKNNNATGPVSIARFNLRGVKVNMMVNKYILIITTLTITFITNSIFKLQFLTGGIITVGIVTLGYIIYINHIQRKRYNILENDLDPEEFIKATYEAYKNAGKNKQLNSLLNIDLAFGYISIGQYKDALEFLHKVEPDHLPKINRSILSYYNVLMIVYYNLNEYHNAKDIYDKVKRYEVKDKLGQQLMNLLIANKYFYEGNYEESRKRFENYPENKMSKRLKLEILFNLANIDEKEGNIKDAILKYEKVAREGNKLYSAKLAKEKLKLNI